jgi:NADPH2:quinone reductase
LTCKLAQLSHLVAEGRLEHHVSVEGSWDEIGGVAQRLLDRGYTGKAILRVGGR